MSTNGTTVDLKEGTIFSLGNPLLDICCDADNEFMEKWELPRNSAILADPVKHAGLYDDMVQRFSDVKYVPGGATQNAIRVAQWFLKKPKVCSFMGGVGDDKYGKLMGEKARADGVDTLYMITNEEKTGTCAVAVTDGGTNRSLCAYLGAANLFKKDHLMKHWKNVEAAKLFYVSGFHLTVSPESVEALASHASQNLDKTFALNLAAPFISEIFGDRVLRVLPYVEILFGNETEAQAIAKLLGLTNSGDLTTEQIAIEIAKRCKHNPNKNRIIVLTQGAENVITVTRPANSDQLEVLSFPVKKLDADKIVDANAAGDAFVGGFLSQFIQKKDLSTCVQAGIYGAQEILQQSGCTLPRECTFKAS
jgi:adenosine kinase